MLLDRYFDHSEDAVPQNIKRRAANDDRERTFDRWFHEYDAANADARDAWDEMVFDDVVAARRSANG